VADLVLMMCLAYRFIYLRFQIDESAAPLISLIITVFFNILNFFSATIDYIYALLNNVYQAILSAYIAIA